MPVQFPLTPKQRLSYDAAVAARADGDNEAHEQALRTLLASDPHENLRCWATNHLSLVLMNQQRLAEARALAEAQVAKLGSDHVYSASALFTLTYVYEALDYRLLAVQTFERLLPSFDEEARPRQRSALLERYSDVLWKVGRFRESGEMLFRAMRGATDSAELEKKRDRARGAYRRVEAVAKAGAAPMILDLQGTTLRLFIGGARLTFEQEQLHTYRHTKATDDDPPHFAALLSQAWQQPLPERAAPDGPWRVKLSPADATENGVSTPHIFFPDNRDPTGWAHVESHKEFEALRAHSAELALRGFVRG